MDQMFEECMQLNTHWNHCPLMLLHPCHICFFVTLFLCVCVCSFVFSLCVLSYLCFFWKIILFCVCFQNTVFLVPFSDRVDHAHTKQNPTKKCQKKNQHKKIYSISHVKINKNKHFVCFKKLGVYVQFTKLTTNSILWIIKQCKIKTCILT